MAWSSNGGSDAAVKEHEDVRPVSVMDDNAGWEVAEQIHEERSDWLVVWGCYSRRFWVYPLFSMRRRLLVAACYPDALLARMDEVERRFRIYPEQEE